MTDLTDWQAIQEREVAAYERYQAELEMAGRALVADIGYPDADHAQALKHAAAAKRHLDEWKAASDLLAEHPITAALRVRR